VAHRVKNQTAVCQEAVEARIKRSSVTATARIQSLAWELPHATGEAEKEKKKEMGRRYFINLPNLPNVAR